MGLWDKITGQFIDVIHWVDDSRDTLVWKFPDKDMEIKMGAQLTVRPSQAAVFVNEGKLADVFTEGRYELTTRNMPIMTTLKSWKHGFDSPFKADVYFVNLQEFRNNRWGTKQPIMVSDPEFSLVQLRAFGTFNFKIADPEKFLRQYASTDKHLTTDTLMEDFRSLILTDFSNTLKRSGKSIAEINMRANELGEELLPAMQDDFSAVGLELTAFYVESVSLPPEIMQALNEQDLEYRKAKKMGTLDNELEMQNIMGKANISQNVGDMEKFQQMMAAMSFDKNGNPSGGGEMSEMMKGMMQMGMMQQMMQNNPGMMNPGAQNAPAQNAGGDEMSKEEVMKMLKDLGELKSAGILSEEEFEAKKKDLLARL